MKKSCFLLVLLLLTSFWCGEVPAQSNNALSIYEGERIQSIQFIYANLPTDSLEAIAIKQKVENSFLVYPYSHFTSFKLHIICHKSKISHSYRMRRSTLQRKETEASI